MRRSAVRSSVPFPLAFCIAASAAGQEERPVSLPVNVTATIDPASLATTGIATLHLRFVCEEALDRALSVRVELRRGGRLLLRRDHAPPVPTKQWAKGKPVEYTLPIAFRTPPANVKPGDTIEIALGFVDAAADKVQPPLARAAGQDGLAVVASFPFPDASAAPDVAGVDAAIAATQALAAKDPQQAWDRLEFVFRRIDDYPAKQKLQKALATIGKMPPPPITFEEADIVRDRIRGERARHLRQ